MARVADFASEFADKAKRGEKPSVYVSKRHAESFLRVLAREGFEFAKEALAQISDPELRRIIEAIFFSTVAGAAAGAAIGAAVAGPAGAQVGAAVGAGLGFVAGCVAVTITARQKDDGLVLQVT